jgi:DNA (cytosine-5)-methyltransferase 1
VKNDYALDYRVLNAAFYGVPQRRERLIVIGIRRDLGKRPEFPKETHSAGSWVVLKEAVGDLLETTPAVVAGKIEQTAYQKKHPPLSLEEPSRTVSSHFAKTSRDALVPVPDHLLISGDSTFDMILVPIESPRELRFVLLRGEQAERIRREREEFDLHRHWGKMEFPDSLDKPSRTISSHAIEGTKRETIVLPLVPDHVMTPSGGWANRKSDWGSRVMRLESPAYTITEKHRSGQLVPVHGEGSAFRRLTVRECMRIQSFPDWWIFPEGVSVSRKYKLVGEAVPPILAYRLAVALGTTLGLEVNLNPKKEDWQLPYFERAFCC